MKKLIILYVCSAFTLNSFAQTYHWLNRGGGTGNESSNALTVDNSGFVTATGEFSGSITIGTTTITSAGGTDMFMVRYNSLGVIQFIKRVGGSANETGLAIASDGSDNIFVCGTFDGNTVIEGVALTSKGGKDIYIAKYSKYGDFIWVKAAGGPGNETVHNMIADPSGNAVLIGSFEGTATFNTTNITSAGGKDIFIVKYTSGGLIGFMTKSGGPLDDEGKGVVADATGNLYVTGYFSGGVNFGTTPLTSNSDSKDIFLAKLDAFGLYLWASKAGSAEAEEANQVGVDGSGNVYIAGSIRGAAQFGPLVYVSVGEEDIILAKYSPAGAVTWVKQYGAALSDKAYSLRVTPSGSCYVTGTYTGNVQFGSTTLTGLGSSDAFVFFVNGSGVLTWVIAGGGSGADVARCVAIDGLGNAYISGSFQATATFGSSNYVSAGQSDFFVSRLGLGTGIGTVHNSAGQIMAYPNPNSGSFFVKSSGTQNTTFTITDISGRILVKDGDLNNNFSFSGFTSGVYFLRSEGEVNETHKIIVK
jgi:hypothetical protein